ncbi:MAG: zinc ribbon domain-containing protein [Lachnospiraceae bacterium]|nr:zinc ribbon domain-containing protein [Lachnospiraceae bacterium]
MFCNNCGNEVPVGQPACPYCGAPVDMGQPMNMGAQPYQAAPVYAAPKKNNTGLIIGIVAAVVAVVAIVLVLKFFVFGAKVDGKYVYDDMASWGMKIELEIDGDEFTMTSLVSYDLTTWEEEEVVEGSVKVDGDEVILTSEGEDVVLNYDKGDETLSMSEGGFAIVFEKE